MRLVDQPRTLPSVTPLRLVSGTTIPDPLVLAREFVRDDGSYQAYDLAPVRHDSTLTETDVRTANRIIARMSSKVVAGVLAARGPVEAALRVIPPDASLMSNEVDWAALEALLAAFEGVPEVGLPRASKVLHKKRPGLIPILDSVVEEYLVRHHRVPPGGGLATRGIVLTRAYRAELLSSLDVLHEVRAALLAEGVDLTECRLLDLYLWAYSGTYTPAWKRRGDPVSPRVISPRSQPVALPLSWPLTSFLDDDDGYLSWLAANPGGYVLNLHRRPRPDYLKLHRTSCSHLARVGVRQWTVDYAKVCSLSTAAIEAWARKNVGGGVDRCPGCGP
ncbi:MAG: hypothetical protein JWM85_36 [Acidimicrobiaceae bacterium]|nr:hypothetical protein [Acidimicrobiaceae bacterium]